MRRVRAQRTRYSTTVVPARYFLIALRGILLKGLDLGPTGKPERAPTMVTKSLLFAADGSGLFDAGSGAGGRAFRAINKRTRCRCSSMRRHWDIASNADVLAHCAIRFGAAQKPSSDETWMMRPDRRAIIPGTTF